MEPWFTSKVKGPALSSPTISRKGRNDLQQVVFQFLVTLSAKGALTEGGAPLGEELVQPGHGLLGMILHSFFHGFGAHLENTQGAFIIPRGLIKIAAEMD